MEIHLFFLPLLRLRGVTAPRLIMAQTVSPGQCKAREKPEDRHSLIYFYERGDPAAGGTD